MRISTLLMILFIIEYNSMCSIRDSVIKNNVTGKTRKSRSSVMKMKDQTDTSGEKNKNSNKIKADIKRWQKIFYYFIFHFL